MKNIMLLVLTCCILTLTYGVSAEELSAERAQVLKQTGIPIYPASTYVNGTTGDITSFRFASSDNVKKVRDWYRKKFPQWALNSEYGSWILYNGKSGGGPAEYMSKHQILIMENKNLQQWFGLPASMTTEVIISLPMTMTE
jgi:hypothetical protein